MRPDKGERRRGADPAGAGWRVGWGGSGRTWPRRVAASEVKLGRLSRPRADDCRTGQRVARPGFDADDPLAPARGLDLDGLLTLLERLDGSEEAHVARGALAAGVPAVVVVEELQREVERRLLRSRAFYDQNEW